MNMYDFLFRYPVFHRRKSLFGSTLCLGEIFLLKHVVRESQAQDFHSGQKRGSGNNVNDSNHAEILNTI